MSVVRTRFAPSPTGDLHLGGAWTALASWVRARSAGAGSAFVVRVEDLDPPRVVAGAAERILEDLRWLGLEWDEEVVYQSARGAAYDAALASLAARGLTYPCDCSRAEIARVASAPHPGEEAVYPGTCRDRDPARAMKRDPATRLRVDDARVVVEDEVLGEIAQTLSRDVGDFVLKRGDGVFAYQLAVTVDDLAAGITHVIRGADLASSTPRQVYVARMLGGEPPAYAHVPLVVAADGSRLAKRTGGARVRELRAAGIDARAMVGKLAHGLGLTQDDAPRTPREVVRALATTTTGAFAWRREPWRIPEAWASVGATEG